ncbi:hypothetical protein TAMA11512_20370 [Selenomonas sp. TAMA-11512]|uniref:DAK2 domain-containing protein n=1 Tax=Selenomonas sp. TAMA-11512 TaxID=3095337 RepID=UPI003090B848|nr:hypothetical protein TAMA11512_20370 [Selenomonas sp. TAMA-11512]
MQRENGEVITGGDFKRMLMGAYSEFLLRYEEINALAAEKGVKLTYPGTHVLRTMGAAVLPLADAKDDSIGGLSRRVASAAVLGGRGNAGVVLGALFRGMAKGLAGKYDVSSSDFGKSFQYGILHAQRALPGSVQNTFVEAAKAVAKGAYRAVRQSLPISEILRAAIHAGEDMLLKKSEEDVGAKMMLIFLTGCEKGLDGDFISPGLSLSLGRGKGEMSLPDPRDDRVRPYCIHFHVTRSKISEARVEKQLSDICRFLIVTREGKEILVHAHTDHPGSVVEQVVGWGGMRNLSIHDMSEPHSIPIPVETIAEVALIAVARDKEHAATLMRCGASVILIGSPENAPAVSEFLRAVHSDFAREYVIVGNDTSMNLSLRQAKRILGDRVEIIEVQDAIEQERVCDLFTPEKSARANKEIMERALENA